LKQQSDKKYRQFVFHKNIRHKTQQKLSEKYAGKLPAEIAEELQNYVNESRQEWNNRNI
jgi:GTP-sensing pleiotropic transcriptional regulator CodY